jgi:hypothetical protein
MRLCYTTYWTLLATYYIHKIGAQRSASDRLFHSSRAWNGWMKYVIICDCYWYHSHGIIDMCRVMHIIQS